jgi:hypothetical protein
MNNNVLSYFFATIHSSLIQISRHCTAEYTTPALSPFQTAAGEEIMANRVKKMDSVAMISRPTTS